MKPFNHLIGQAVAKLAKKKEMSVRSRNDNIGEMWTTDLSVSRSDGVGYRQTDTEEDKKNKSEKGFFCFHQRLSVSINPIVSTKQMIIDARMKIRIVIG